MNVSIKALKHSLCIELISAANEAQLTQRAMAELLQTTQPRVSNIFNYRVEKFSLDTLYKYLDIMGIEAVLTVTRPKPKEV